MYLGIDIGSVSIKFAVINDKYEVIENDYFRSKGDLINATRKLLKRIKTKEFKAICITGSGRKFLSALLSADLDIDEITAHRKAVSIYYPDVKTIFEIGGQDSKLINIFDNIVDFEMNNVCAAGTGSFIDQQASRIEIPLIKFYKKGLETEEIHEIASKCTVFAETDMVHAQQSGIPLNKIIRGVHRGIVNNYFSQLCQGKELKGKFLFEGGTSENKLLIDELAQRLIQEKLIKNKNELIVPKYNKILGAIGAAIFGKINKINNNRPLPKINKYKFISSSRCQSCQTKCGARIITFKINNQLITMGKTCQQ